MTAMKTRASLAALLATPMRRTRIVEEEDRGPLAIVVVVTAIIYVLTSILLGSSDNETMLGVVVGVILATIAILAILYWLTRRRQSS